MMKLNELMWTLNNTYLFDYDTHTENFSSNLHAHRSYEIIILESGSTTILLDDKLYPLSEGEILLISPDSLHKNNGGAKHSRYAIHFTMDYLLNHFQESVCTDLTHIFKIDKLSVKARAFRIISEIMKHTETDFGKKHPYIHIAEILSVISDPSNHSVISPKIDNAIIQNVMNYVHNNYNTITGLDDIALHASISKEYLCQVFKKETGLTVSHYLNGVKISKACELLRSGSTNITETALLCGYNSPMYFYKVFKNIMRMTPKEYRNNNAPFKFAFPH